MSFLNIRRLLRPLALAVLVAAVFSIGWGSGPAGAGPDASTTAATSAPASVPDAVPDAGHAAAHGQHVDMTPTVRKTLLLLLLILCVAKIGGDLLERIHQPAVLGELLFGIILGNLGLFHVGWLTEFTQTVLRDPTADQFITVLAEIGVVLLLFEVGLESTVQEMMSVGISSLVVAVVGVIAPVLLGIGVCMVFLADEPWTVHLFVGTVLAATSVGITARVLRDLGKMHLREAKIILGAAVIDDILGLIVLAVVQGVVAAVNTGTPLQTSTVIWIVAKAGLFFGVALVLGRLVSKRLYRLATYLRVKGVLITVTLGWCFLIAYLGTLVGLAPIVGAFAAGLVLEDATFGDWQSRDGQLEDLLAPITTFLVPVFFVHMGMQVDLRTFAQWQILGFAGALTAAAILGKQVCAFGAVEKGLNRLAIGVGMIPRGEVGLIVAGIGMTLKTDQGMPLVSQDVFSAAVIMICLTTMLTPPILKLVLERRRD